MATVNHHAPLFLGHCSAHCMEGGPWKGWCFGLPLQMVQTLVMPGEFRPIWLCQPLFNKLFMQCDSRQCRIKRKREKCDTIFLKLYRFRIHRQECVCWTTMLPYISKPVAQRKLECQLLIPLDMILKSCHYQKHTLHFSVPSRSLLQLVWQVDLVLQEVPGWRAKKALLTAGQPYFKALFGVIITSINRHFSQRLFSLKGLLTTTHPHGRRCSCFL